MTDRMAGFSPLRPDRIHLRCPMCGRKQSNMPRFTHDPPTAALLEIPCERHDGLKDPEPSYYNATGNEIDFNGERWIDPDKTATPATTEAR